MGGDDPRAGAGAPGPRPSHPLALTVLPGAGHLVEADGRPVVLVDAGGAAIERLWRHGADPSLLAGVLLTRLDAARTGGIAPVMVAANVPGRAEPLRVVGPGGRPGATGTCRFIDLLFGPRGAWRDLSEAGGVLRVVECRSGADAGECPPMDVGGVRVRAAALHGAGPPAVAFRIERARSSLVVCADPLAGGDLLAELASGCDALACDSLPSDRASAAVLGRVAALAGCGMVVLGAPAGAGGAGDLLEAVRRRYEGPLVVAEDVTTLDVGSGRGHEPDAPTAVAGVPF